MARRASALTRGNTPIRGIRVPDPLWTAAQTVAADRGDNLSDIIRKALREYIETWGTK